MKLFKITLFFFYSSTALAFSLHSTHQSFQGTGKMFGLGSDGAALPEMRVDNLAFSNKFNLITPFFNNGGKAPNICSERTLKEKPTGLLSDHKTKINENVDACSITINGDKVLLAVIDSGSHSGEQLFFIDKNGHLASNMDVALDSGSGEEGIIRVPFHGTTGKQDVPFSLQSQKGKDGGEDFAGSIESGAELQGRIGDYNGDGFLDGTLLFVGNIPLSSKIFAGAPYVFFRNFETDIPISGKILGKLPR